MCAVSGWALSVILFSGGLLFRESCDDLARRESDGRRREWDGGKPLGNIKVTFRICRSWVVLFWSETHAAIGLVPLVSFRVSNNVKK